MPTRRGRTNSVAEPALQIEQGVPLQNCIYLRALLRFLQIVITFVVFVYLVIITSNPALDGQPGDPLAVARQGGPGHQRGQRRALVAAPPALVHPDAEHHDGTEAKGRIRRLALTALPLVLVVIAVSIMFIMGRMPLVDVRALAGLSMVIQAEFFEVEVPGASHLNPGGPVIEGSVL